MTKRNREPSRRHFPSGMLTAYVTRIILRYTPPSAEMTGGNGVDVVYDPVGLLIPSLKCAAWNSRLVVVGFAAGSIEKVPANLVLLKNCSITGVFWGAYSKNEVDKIPECWNALLEMFEQKRIKPTVFSRVYQGLEELPQGLMDLSERKTWGKAVVRIREDAGK